MRKKVKMPAWTFFALRLVIGGLFVFSGYSKLMGSSANFAGVILTYQIVDLRTAAVMASVLPWVQFIAGVFFILGLWFRPSLWVLWGMNAVFTGAIASTLVRGIRLADCGCFGEVGHAVPVEATLALDIVIFFVFLWMNANVEEAGSPGLDRRLKA